MDVWDELRFATQVMNDAKRTLICEPGRVEEFRALVEAWDTSALFEVRSSAACPPGRVLVLDEQALSAAQNQTLQQIMRGVGVRRP